MADVPSESSRSEIPSVKPAPTRRWRGGFARSSARGRRPFTTRWRLTESPAAEGGFSADTGSPPSPAFAARSEEHTSELQSLAYLVCRLLLEKKKKKK